MNKKILCLLICILMIIPIVTASRSIENKKEIDHYYENFWELKNKKITIEDIIKLHDLEKDKLFKYLDSKKASTPNISYDKWDSIFKDMLSAGVEISDSYFTKLFRILIKKEEYLKLFGFLNTMIENTKTGYLLILKLMKSANLKKKVVTQQLLKNITKDNEQALIDALSENLVPSYQKELKEWIKDLNNPVARVLLIQVMQNTAPKFFKEEIQAYLEKNIDSKKFNKILSRLDDEKLKETLFNEKLSRWFNATEILQDYPDFQKTVFKYITSSSKKSKTTNSILEQYKKMFKYENYFNFWENFVNNFTQSEENKVMYDKSFKLSLIFDPHTTMSQHITFKNDMKTTLELLVENNIPVIFYLKYLIKEIHKQEDKGELIVEFINKSFKDVIDSLEFITIKEKTAVLPIIWKHQKSRFAPYLFSITNTNSKTIQAAIKLILKDEDDYLSEIKDLLKARKASTRAIAVEVLLGKNDKNIEDLLRTHLETEKSELIRKLIRKVLG